MAELKAPGLHFRKLDLHIHTPASHDFDDKKVEPSVVVAKALELGLDAIAITDHNTGDWIDRVKTAAKGTGLIVFPGVEITCAGGASGIHIIALFDPSREQKHVTGLLSELKLKPEEMGNPEALVTADPMKVAETIASRGALCVLAHANSTKGALNEMRGQQRIALVNSPFVNAAEATDFAATGKKRTCDFFDGTDPEYGRELAVYQASDNPAKSPGHHSVDGIGARVSFFKFDHIDLDGLRQCFADPKVRIRQDGQPANYPRIARVTIHDGFLGGQTVRFHSGLNSILGGKGSGKSLLVELIRFALDQDSANPEIQADHESKLAGRLGQYGRVELVIEDETGHETTITREYHGDGDSQYADEQSARAAANFPVLFLSQGEIVRIAESPDEQIGFIDRFFDFRAHQAGIDALKEELSVLDKQFGDAARAQGQLADLEREAKAIQAEIERIEKSLKNQAFEDFAKAEQKKTTFVDHLSAIDAQIAEVGRFQTEVANLGLPDLPEGLTADAALKRAADVLKITSREIDDSLTRLLTAIRSAKAKTKADYDSWLPSYKAVSERYTAVVRESGGDYKVLAELRAKKIRERDEKKKAMGALAVRAGRLKDVATQRKAKLDALATAHQNYSQERRERCAKFEAGSHGRLKITLQEATDASGFRERLSSLKRGSYLKDSEIAAISTHVDPSTFVSGIMNYSLSHDEKKLSTLATKTGLEAGRIQSLADFLLNTYEYEALLSLQYSAVPKDHPDIKFQVEEGVYRPLPEVSVGQKCTAMLIIALTDGVMPIVIDQPEDSLDIKSVWEDMCLRIRSGKERRQFVFTTHNSSLAVASDTDAFTILEAGADTGRVLCSGAMDHAPVNDEVLKYLEGGVETYRRKYSKYRGDLKVR
jgi:PHP family Zn ribbon phosphoesterase